MWHSDITVVSLHQHYNTYSAWFLDIRIYQLVLWLLSQTCPSSAWVALVAIGESNQAITPTSDVPFARSGHK